MSDSLDDNLLKLDGGAFTLNDLSPSVQMKVPTNVQVFHLKPGRWTRINSHWFCMKYYKYGRDKTYVCLLVCTNSPLLNWLNLLVFKLLGKGTWVRDGEHVLDTNVIINAWHVGYGTRTIAVLAVSENQS
jgi:hypothetical protein